MSGNNPQHANDIFVDRHFTRVDIYSKQRNNLTESTTDGALVVHSGDVAFNNDLRVKGTVYADTFFGNNANIFTEFQLINGTQNEGYVLTSDSLGKGNWKTPHWFTNDVPVDFNAPTDNVIWTEHSVGIGVTGIIQSPNEILHVATTTAGQGAQLGRVFVGNWADNSTYGIVGLSALKANSGAYGIKMLPTGENQYNSFGQLQLRVNDIPAVHINSNRYVGIGTLDPQEQLHITQNALIEGNLEVLGNTTTLNTQTLTIEDNMVKLASNNISDIVDFGIYGLYIDNGVTKFSGLYRDASEHDSLYKLFTNSSTEPGSTVVDGDLAILRASGFEAEVGITFDAGSRLRHNELIISGGSEPNYIDQVWFKSDGKIGIGISSPNVDLEIAGDVNTEGNLGIGISIPNPNYSIDTDRTDAYRIPTGTVAQRPVGIKGLFRFNDEAQIYEAYYDNGMGDAGWRTVGVVIDADFDTYIEPELNTDDDHLRFFTFGDERMTITNTGDIGISQPNPTVKFHINGTDAIKIPSGTTLERPLGGSTGVFPSSAMTANTTALSDGTYIVTTSSALAAGYFSFDDNTTTSWASSNVYDTSTGVYTGAENLTGTFAGEWIKIQMPNPIIVSDYDMTNRNNGFNARAPSTFKLFGSNDDVTWTELNSQSLVQWGSGPITKNFIVSTSTAYTYFAIVTSLIGNTGSSSRFRLESLSNIEFNGTKLITENGQIRYNTTDQLYEGYSTKFNQWESLLHLRDGDRDTYITPEETADDDCIKMYSRGELRMVVKGDYTGGGDITEPRIGIGVTTADPLYPLEIRSTQAALIPVGDSSERPANAEFGLIRYNTEKEHFEGYGQSHLGFKKWSRLQDPIIDNDGDTEITVEALSDEDRIRFRTAGEQRVVFDANGYVGIGISTPRVTLDVIGDSLVSGNSEVLGDVVIGGDLTVQGDTFQTNTTTVLIEDPLLKLATNNPADNEDIGFYGLYDGLGVSKYTGLVRDATDGYYMLFEQLGTDPLTNVVDFADVGITRAPLRVNIIDTEFIDFPDNDLKIRTSNGADKVVITSDPYVGINTTPKYPLHVTTEYDQNWSTRIKNGPNGTDLFLAHTEGQGMSMNTKVTSASGNYAVQIRNSTFSSSNPLFQIMNSGRIGIHTSAPENLIHISTTTAGQGINVGDETKANAYGFLGLYDGSAAYMSIGNLGGSLTHTTDYALRQGTSGDTWINAATGQNITLGHNNVAQVYVDTNGNVGIGSATPAANLDVVGDVQILENNAFFAFRVDNDTTSVDIAHNDGSGVLVDSGITSSFAYQSTNNGSTTFVTTQGGLVGINTDNPLERLHINTTAPGQGALIGSAQIGDFISDQTIATFANSMVYDETGSYALRQNSLGKTELNSKTGQDLCFNINNSNQMILTSTGNLGIGSTTPTNKLEVGGNTRLDGNVVITGTLNFEGPFVESLVFEDNLLKLAGNNTTNTLDIGFYGCYVELGDTKYAGTFYDASDDVWRVFHDLEVEPGVTVPTMGTGYTASKLVVGDQYVINNLGVGIENPTVKVDVDGEVRADNYITTSDERTKQVLGFVDEKESYNKIKDIDIFNYYLKNDERQRTKTGFIAQQLERSMPEAVITMEKKIENEIVDDFKGVDQYTIIANLTNALKHAIKKIEKLEEEVLSLKIKNSLNQL